jgi:hypothetical protein
MDSLVVLHMSQWIMAELVRLLHKNSVDEAKVLVDSLVQRTVPPVWQVEGRTRVLDAKLALRDQVLLIVYYENGKTTEGNVASSVKRPKGVLRRDVIRKLDEQALVDLDESSGTVTLSPRGIVYVEQNLLNVTIG